MIVRWFISEVVIKELTDEAGNTIKRRMPKFMAEDKYGDSQWSAVYHRSLDCLVRMECVGDVDETYFVKEISTAEDWTVLYSGYPELKEKWVSQPRGLNG